MEKQTHPSPDRGSCDLERRLDRYRSRVASEGRHNSVRQIDRAIQEAKVKPGCDLNLVSDVHAGLRRAAN